jgi:hypothetical protein
LAHVSGSARVSDSARVSGSAHVSGSALVYGSAFVYDSAHVSKTPVSISGLRHNITVTETHIFIGCEGHTIEHWRKEVVNIGRKHGYSDDEIKQVIKLLKAVLPKKEKKT